MNFILFDNLKLHLHFISANLHFRRSSVLSRSLMSDLSENMSALDLAPFADQSSSRRDLFGDPTYQSTSRRDLFADSAADNNISRRDFLSRRDSSKFSYADVSMSGLSVTGSSRRDSLSFGGSKQS